MKCEPDPSLNVQVGPLAPVDLAPLRELPTEALHFTRDGVDWYRPIRMDKLLELKERLVKADGASEVKLVVGNTASVLWPKETPKHLIDIAHIRELNGIEVDEAGIHSGATVPIQKLVETAETLVAERPAAQTTGLRELVRHAQHIAGIQVRNAGSIAGNIAICRNHDNFPSDVFTVLATLGTTVTVASRSYKSGTQDFALEQLPPAEDLPADALMQTFHVPYTRPREYVQTYRVARRPQMSHAFVTAGFRLLLDNADKVVEATAIFGGIAAQIHRAVKSEACLGGKLWSPETLGAALRVIRQEIAEKVVPMDEEGISEEYRTALAENFFYKFFVHVANQINPDSVEQVHSSAGALRQAAIFRAAIHPGRLARAAIDSAHYQTPGVRAGLGRSSVHARHAAADRRFPCGADQEHSPARPLSIHEAGSGDGGVGGAAEAQVPRLSRSGNRG